MLHLTEVVLTFNFSVSLSRELVKQINGVDMGTKWNQITLTFFIEQIFNQLDDPTPFGR